MTESALAVSKLAGEIWLDPIDFDPNVTTAVDVKWYPEFKNFGCLMAQIVRRIGTGAVTHFKIMGNTAVDGTGTDYDIKSHAIASEPDALHDSLILEITADEVARVGDEAGVRILAVSVSLRLASGTDEFVVNHVFGDPRYKHGALTADNVA